MVIVTYSRHALDDLLNALLIKKKFFFGSK